MFLDKNKEKNISSNHIENPLCRLSRYIKRVMSLGIKCFGTLKPAEVVLNNCDEQKVISFTDFRGKI